MNQSGLEPVPINNSTATGNWLFCNAMVQPFDNVHIEEIVLERVAEVNVKT